MALFGYSKFKIRIDPQSKKTQGLQVGDIVRRQYLDGEKTIYSLMVVLETGIEVLRDQNNNEHKSPFFVGALLDGDEPKTGELLDFVRTTSLFNTDRSGAMYLTASDNNSPYMDVVDGMAFNNSLCYPYMGGGDANTPSVNKYACAGSSFLTTEYYKSNQEANRVFRITRNAIENTNNEVVGFKQTIEKKVHNPQMVVVSYKTRASKTLSGVNVSFGYVDGTEIDGSDTVNIGIDWGYKVSLIIIDFPEQYDRSLLIDLTSHLSEGDWCEISDLNLVLLSDVSDFSKSTKSRIGKIKGIVDPIFGAIDGYGAYFQSLYATKNINISGTLTAGDANGFGATFYVGKIHKNCLINSLYGNFTTDINVSEEVSPTGIGKVFSLPVDKTVLICQTNDWGKKHNRQKYCFSFWAKSKERANISISQNENTLQSIEIEVLNEWVRYSVPFITKTTNGADFTIEFLCDINQILFTSPQLEIGEKASLYQATDEKLDDTDTYGAWFSRGGIGGTIQNPLLRLNIDGSISSNNGSFVINRDGSGHFSHGAITWNEDEVVLGDNVILKWDNLSQETQENLKGESAYSVNSTVTSYVFQSNGLGIITTNQSVTAKIYAYKGKNAVTNIVIGDIPSIEGMSIDKNDTLKTISFSVSENTNTLPDSGNIEIPILVDGMSFIVPFSFSKAKAGASGSDTGSLEWVMDWDNNKTQIGSETIITPKIFAGKKNENETITGVAIGNFNINSKNPEGAIVSTVINGIHGFKDGETIFSIDESKGIIGGWEIDMDSIFIGTKNNVTGSFTQNKNDVTIGNNGIRGNKWYFDSNGNSQLGDGNQFIKYDSVSGKILFGEGVTLNWQNAIDTAKTDVIQSATTIAQEKADVAKNSAISVAATDATNKVNAIQVGTKNLLLNSNLGFGHQGSDYYMGKMEFSSPLVKGKTYTLIVNSSVESGHQVGVYPNSGYGSCPMMISYGETLKRATFTVDWDVKDDYTLSYYFFPQSTTGAAYINWAMLVEGNKAPTSWMAAPEDTVVGGENLIALTKLSSHTPYNTTPTYSGNTITTKYVRTTPGYTIAINISGFSPTINKIYTTTGRMLINGVPIKKDKFIDKRQNTYLGKALRFECNNNGEFIFISHWNVNSPWIFHTGIRDIKVDDIITIEKLTMVEGNTPCAWSPSPFDIDQKISNAQKVADSITKKANDEGWATKLTYIGSTGIFTGTLSANTVNAVRINASQITAGTIDAARINVTDLKSKLITAANIEALDLNVVRGKIGGWGIDSNSIYIGTKNNTSGAYTSSASSITIGTLGIRGYKWKLDVNGAGALAGGNISWDTAGNVTFGSSVSLQWKNDIEASKSTNFGYRYSKSIIINGESNKYYPVVFKGGDQNSKRDIFIYRSYSEQAPSEWNPSIPTQHGSLSLLIKTNFGNWGGSSYFWKIYELEECYTNMFAGASHCGNSCMFAVFLRGGGTTGAIYHLYSDQPIDSNAFSPSPIPPAPQIAYNSDLIFKINDYLAYAPAPRTHGSTVTQEIMAHKNALSTYISNSGIYTGTLNANQINAGTISADRIAANSLNGNKLIARTISADKIVSGAITANEIATNTIVSSKIAVGTILAANIATRTISADKIVTGAITANEIASNAITTVKIAARNITADKIVTGAITANEIASKTITAAKIAAGTITASEINVSSVQASVVTATAVNGLSCTFTKGKIGGFTIASDSMTVGSFGTSGAAPIQIRSVSSGSGIWYNGAYRPYGITLTWYRDNNAGHIAFGQVAATANSPKTGFAGIQMMNHLGYEYFCLSTNALKSGGLEVYNRIAGWAFDYNHIWKNSVSLGADGSIQNGTKWQINNDGSGRLANGNISWNAAGVVTFGSSVSLNWTNAAISALDSAKYYADVKKNEAISSASTDATNKSNAAKELAMAMAFGKMLYRDPVFFTSTNKINPYNNSANGTVGVSRISDSTAPNDSKYILEIQNKGAASPSCGGFYFGTATSSGKVFITRIIAKIPVGRNIIFASNSIGSGGSASKWLTPNAGTGNWCEYVYKVKCGINAPFSSTNYFYLDGAVGSTTNPVKWYVAYATVFDLTSTEKYVTTIDADGIYTGTVRANQVLVDSALVVGGSSYNGSISVRDANNVVKVTLDRTGITAVGGKVGGFVLTDHDLHSINVTAGHTIGIQNNGYMYNCNSSTSVDYWALNTDGSAIFGIGRTKFAADGSGWLANKNITWDAVGNVTMKGVVTATGGKIGDFNISAGTLVNANKQASIQFTGLDGSYLNLNKDASLISLRSDTGKTGINIQVYTSNAIGMRVLANAGSKYAIESYGPCHFSQRAGEWWCMPGVLFAGLVRNGRLEKVWGNGGGNIKTNGSTSYITITHELNHTDYFVTSNTYYGGNESMHMNSYIRVEGISNTTFALRVTNADNGSLQNSSVIFTVVGRNKLY